MSWIEDVEAPSAAHMDDALGDRPEEPTGPRDKTAEELIRLHQAGLWRYLRMLGCDSSLADDLTQEAFLKVLKRDDFTQHSDNATAAYLRRTAHNLLVSLHRKGGRKKTTFTSDPLDEIWDRWAGRDISGDVAIDSLRECMQGLTSRAQLALRMRFAEDSTRASIAEALAISEHGARNLMQRAKQQLRDCVQQKLSELEDNE